METKEKEVIKESPASDDTKVEETKVETTEQDPLKEELARVQTNQDKSKRTPEEKLLHKKKIIDAEVAKLGLDEEEEEDDDKPVTRGELKKMQAEQATKTALDLAEDISNETERELVKHYLTNTIRSTGNPQEDLRLARGLVNSVKNKQILEEVARKPVAKTHGSGSGAPPKELKQEEFTDQERVYMAPPFNLTKEEILKARQGIDSKPEKKK